MLSKRFRLATTGSEPPQPASSGGVPYLGF